MSPPNRALRCYCDKTRLIIGIILLLVNLHIFFGCSIFNLIPPNTPSAANLPDDVSAPIPWTPIRTQADLRIAKATIRYESRTYDAHTLALDELHTQNFGYTSHLLRTPIVRGALNKFLYLQSLVIAELQKPVDQQVEWILYHNPTVILANPNIPLHPFLPPITDIETFKTLSIIATEFERETQYCGVLHAAMEGMYNAPDNENGDEDAEISSHALQHVLSRPYHREKDIFQPQGWYNSTASLFYQPYYPTPAHRLLAVTDTVAVDHKGQIPMFPDAETTHRSWHAVSEARRVLDEAKEKGHTSEQGAWWEMVKEVEDSVELRAWDTGELERRVEALREGLGIE